MSGLRNVSQRVPDRRTSHREGPSTKHTQPVYRGIPRYDEKSTTVRPQMSCDVKYRRLTDRARTGIMCKANRCQDVLCCSGVAIGCAGCAVHRGPRHSGAFNRLGRNFLRF